MERPLFSADSIGKSFGRKSVLKAATVWAPAGEITVLFGRNGSGKSTLLRVSVGQLSADFGAVHFDGEVYPRPRLHRLDARPPELSGGERRRAELAIARARRPRCLLADEPFAGITPGDAEAVAAALVRLADSGCAVLATGHEVPQLMTIASSVVWMTAGTTHWLGPPGEAARHEQFRREYLGPGHV